MTETGFNISVANDPFLTHSALARGDTPRQTVNERTQAKRQRLRGPPPSLFSVALLPTLLILGTSLSFVFTFHFQAAVPWCIVLGGLWMASKQRPADAVGGSKLMVGYHGEPMRQKWMAPTSSWAPLAMSIAGIILGIALGLWVYETYMVVFFQIGIGPWYHNALAGNPGATYGDAGAVQFAAGSLVDTSKALGYRSMTTYCVAPVLSINPDHSQVNFWAVGTDCCGVRGTFWCGDAGEPGAHWAVREPSAGWFFNRARNGYDLAIRQAEAVYQLNSDPDRELVRWVSDPEKEVRNALVPALAFTFGSAFIFLLFGLAIHLYDLAGLPGSLVDGP